MDLHINPSLPSRPQTLVPYDFDWTHRRAGSLTELWTRPLRHPKGQQPLHVWGLCSVWSQTVGPHNTQSWARLVIAPDNNHRKYLGHFFF